MTRGLQIEGFLARRGGHHLEAIGAQGAANELTDGVIVLHQEDDGPGG